MMDILSAVIAPLLEFLNKIMDVFSNNKKDKNTADKKLFEESNKILGENDLMEFFEEIVSLRYSSPLSDKVDDFLKYFEIVSNTYFNKKISNNFYIFINSLKQLYSEVCLKSKPHPTLYKRGVLILFTEFEEEIKHRISEDFNTLCNEVEDKYTIYRKLVKEILYI